MYPFDRYYRFSLRQLAAVLVPILVCLVGIGACLHVLEVAGWLPGPAPGLDPDRTTVVHQSRACSAKSDARILVVGDCTCLCGVDPLIVSEHLPGRPPVLNLALYGGIDLTVYGEEVEAFAAANPGQVRSVVLLVHPAKLAGVWVEAPNVWSEIRHPRNRGPLERLASIQADLTGAQLLRQNLLSYALEAPLKEKGAALLGFGSMVDTYLSLHRGSSPALGVMAPIRSRGRPLPEVFSPLPLLPRFEARSRVFRAKMPAAVKLFVGLTPSTADVASPVARQQQLDLLQRWNAWLQADVLLTNLPATLPPGLFAFPEHLNPAGRKYFSARVARELAYYSDF